MGWNSYDCFGCFVNERRALENLRVFSERLIPHGYEYFVIDAGWYRQFDLAGREFPDKDDAYTVRHDEFGRPVPSVNFFPNGIAPLATACHAAGAKFGIHMMRGIPRHAVEANTPVKGTGIHARDIAEAGSTCNWCPDNFGVALQQPGAPAYYASIIELLAGWGVDFIKYDDIIPSPPEVDAVVDAIEKCGRDIVLSLSPGNGHNADGWPAYRRANMTRTSGDIWDSRDDFQCVFERWQAFMDYQLPDGCWLDMDMIPFGELQVWNPGGETDNILMNGRGAGRMSQLNSAQKRTFLTMRALAASPLMMGGNLPGTDEETFRLLTNHGMLACNQNGVTGKLVTSTDWTSIWKTPHRTRSDAGWFGIFNRDGVSPREVVVAATVLGIPEHSRLYDVWNHCDLGDLSSSLLFNLPPDEVLFVRYGEHSP